MLPVVPVRGEKLVETVAVAAILLVAALVAVSPHLLIGFPHGHSVNVNIFWHECFSEQLLAGELLPRWLFSFWGGLGAPVFYFYAPFPFYVLSLIDLFPVGRWGDFAVLSIGHLLLFFLSGAAFYVFVRPYTDRFWATVIAIGYMFAPYHYIDVEVRSAMGEASAYIWIPLILIGVCGPEKKWRSTVLAACGYAGLILSHLPSALLAAPAIALFSVLSGDRSGWLRAVGHALVVGVLGVALSAFYVLPALMLRDTLPHDAWVSGYGPHYAATSSLIGSSTVSRFSGTVHELLAWTSLVGVGCLALYIAVSKSRFSKGLEQPSKRMTAAIITVLCLCWFLMSSLSWPIWEYFPFLSEVQFSWRLGVLVDICSLLLVALFAPPVIRTVFSGLGFAGQRRRMLEYAVCSLALGALAISMMQGFFPPTVRAKSHIGRTRTLAPVEYRTRWLVESPLYLGSRTVGRPEKHRRRTRGSPQGNRPVGEIRQTAALDRCSEGLAARGVSQHQVRQRHASHDFGSDRFRGNDPPQEGLLSPLAADGYRWWGGGGSSRRTDRASDLRASARSTPIDLGSTHPACGARGDSRVVIRRGGNPRWIVGVPTSLPLQSAATGSGSQCPARGAMVSLEAKLGHIASHSSLVSKLLALPPQPPQMNSSHSPVSEL